MRQPGQPARIVPEAPRPGDTLGIVAPASAVQKDQFEAGCAALRERGFKVFFFESILDRELYFAGDHARRAWELEQMFLKPFVKAVICARGGYGSNYLPAKLRPELFHDNPKMFMGYSDQTTLLTWLCDQCDLVTYHGPMVAKDWAENGESQEELRTSGFAIERSTEVAQLRPGQAEGVLYGGCLSLLAASLGTDYEIQTDGTVLFMEDVNAKPYQIDRMLMQLRHAGKLDSVRGIVFGEMLDCHQPGGQEYTLQEVVLQALDGLEMPIGWGVPSGHVSRPPNRILPIGARASLVVEEKKVTLRTS